MSLTDMTLTELPFAAEVFSITWIKQALPYCHSNPLCP
ncbi:hypothetical protein CFter6_2204 [Collimonas fungivorans]|uniref:Uncharacterized protein n=1 Tax=Collimonas fungivorans TaxID=158899 RepID=A0A127PBT0_9BURK|nr:hypothetical protein CFter6_2204 [Collimonas fungivorans]